jgi:hypothetical protein
MPVDLIPKGPNEITPAWLTSVLRSTGVIRDAIVIDCQVSTIGEGIGLVGQLLKLKINYDRAQPGAPLSLVAKMPSTNPQNDRYWGQPGRSIHEKEIRFYQSLAPSLSIRTPRCFFAAASWDKRLSIILLEDLSWARQGDQLKGCSIEDAKQIIREWAAFHAAFWNNDRLQNIPDLPGYTTGTQSLQQRFDTAWPTYLETFSAELPEEITSIGDRLLSDSGKEIRTRLLKSPSTLCHGDFRSDNLFFIDKERRIAVIDWTGLRSGPGVWDISHFVSQGLEPQIRQSCESELLQLYHASLAEHGVCGYSLEQAIYDYRLSMLTHLQKLVRGFASFDIVNDRHSMLLQTVRRRVISAVISNYGDDLFD